MKELFCILFMLFGKYFSVMMNFSRVKHVAINDMYLVMLTGHLLNNYMLTRRDV